MVVFNYIIPFFRLPTGGALTYFTARLTGEGEEERCTEIKEAARYLVVQSTSLNFRCGLQIKTLNISCHQLWPSIVSGGHLEDFEGSYKR